MRVARRSVHLLRLARGWALRLGATLVALLAASPARAHDRLMRAFDERSGLQVSEIVELAQDSTGFLWVGTSGGLVRFDGREMRSWAPDRVHHVVRSVSCGPGGAVLVAAANEPLWRVTADGVEPLAGPDRRPIDDWVHASFDRAGDIWTVSTGTLRVRDTHEKWRTLDSTAFDTSAFYRVRPWVGDTVFVATERALWRMSAHGAPVRVAGLPRVQDVAPMSNGRIAVVTRRAHLVTLDRDGVHELMQGGDRASALVARDGVLWVTLDRYVLRLAPGAPPDTIAPTVTTPTGRPLLVDREGSLWLGGYHGLLQFPEPETVVWDQRDGMPNPPHAFMVHHDAEGVWVSTWFGAVAIPDSGLARRARPLGSVPGGFFSDGAGDLWWAWTDHGFMRRHHGVDQRLPRAGLHRLAAAAPRPDGTLWLTCDDGLFITPRGAGAPRAVTTPPPPEFGATWTKSWIGAVMVDRHGELWITQDELVAHAPADSVDAGRPVHWQVERLAGTDYALALDEMPSGAIWAGTSDGGVWRHGPRGWERIPGSRALASPRVYDLAPSPSGGIWVLSDGSILRVRERLDQPDGWEVLEDLTAWQGAPSRQTGGLVELPDRRIWLASLAGVVEMPASARHARKRPPAVALVDQRLDGRSLPRDRPVRLPARRNRLELRFAALSYRDPSLLRYQYRMHADAPWNATLDPDIHLVDLSPGNYDIEVRASLDGMHWTDPPAIARFSVMAPWWRQWWAMAVAALLLFGLMWSAHRVRVAVLLRLERQRTRIAMDLHDEMGSGLGSIGILAGLASEPRLDDGTRRQLAGRIAEAAGELGGSLSDIVWSLRADGDTLEAFAFRLAERAGRLFPDPPPVFATRFPERWPELRLSPELRRQLQLVALEALHNAARHAHAAHVTLGLEPAGARWRMWVEDDGRGLPVGDATPTPGGNGLGNLRRRAISIGGVLELRGAPGAGTCVTLTFDPGADPARPRRGVVA